MKYSLLVNFFLHTYLEKLAAVDVRPTIKILF